MAESNVENMEKKNKIFIDLNIISYALMSAIAIVPENLVSTWEGSYSLSKPVAKRRTLNETKRIDEST